MVRRQSNAAVNERARTAVSEFRKLQPTLTAFARNLTNNPKVQVVLGKSVPRTDGKIIEYPPPIALGDRFEHDRELCDKRDWETLQQLCPACRVREGIMSSIYHEISHIAYASFEKPDRERLAEAMRYVKIIAPPKYADRIVRRIASSNEIVDNYVALASAINPYFKVLYNCLEDVRINAKMHRARPGTKPMMDAHIMKVMTEGIQQHDGTIRTWPQMHLNHQACIGAYLFASGFELQEGWLASEVIEALKDDELRRVLVHIAFQPSTHDVFEVSGVIFLRLRDLGFFQLAEEKEEDADEQDDEEDAGPPPPAPPTPPQPGSTPPQPDDESDAEDAGDPGEDDSSHDPGADESAGEDEEVEQPEEDSDDPAGSGDPGEEAGPESEDAGESEGDATGGDDDESAPESDEEEGAGEPASVGEGDDADSSEPTPAEPGDGDEMDEDAGVGGDDDDTEQSEDGEDDTTESDGDLPESPDGDEGAEAGDDGDDEFEDGESGDAGGDEPEDHEGSEESSDDDGDAGSSFLVEPDEDAEEEDIDLDGMGLHAHMSEPTRAEEKAVEVAIVQGEYFEKPSVNIAGVNEWHHENMNEDVRNRTWHAWNPRITGTVGSLNRRGHGVELTPETILAPALMRMRLVFAENKRTQRSRNQKSGKLDARVLGRRAWNDDDRLFGKKVIPGKRDYVVYICIDVSGSTAGPNLMLIKQAAMAKAELLSRMGIPFAIFAHTGSPTGASDLSSSFGETLSLDIYHIKATNEPWDDKVKQRLADIGPSYCNLDGHAMEYYRRMIERENATDRVILYYSDGKMPLENYHEELEILQREIATCKQKMIHLLGVGIRTDSPRKHGLDTVQVDDSSDVIRVVQHLERTLVS